MALLGDALTDRDKVEYFMSSLVKKSHLVRKINLTSTFDQACRDIVDYVSKEQIDKTICSMLNHATGLFGKADSTRS